jgi:hypothetical protein
LTARNPGVLFHKRNDLVGIDFQLNCVERRHRDLRKIQLTDQFSSIVHDAEQRTGVVGQVSGPCPTSPVDKAVSCECFSVLP